MQAWPWELDQANDNRTLAGNARWRHTKLRPGSALEAGSFGDYHHATPGGGEGEAWLRGNSALGEGRAGKQILVTSSDPWIQLVLMPDPTLQCCTFTSQSSPLAVEAGQSWFFYHWLLKDPSQRGWPIIKQDFESPIGLLPKHRPSCFLLCLLKSQIPWPCCSFLGLHPVTITYHLIVAMIQSLYKLLALIFFCLETQLVIYKSFINIYWIFPMCRILSWVPGIQANNINTYLSPL